MRKIILLFGLIFIGCNKDDETSLILEPKFFTTDIDLFWQVFENTTTNFSTEEFQSLYISQGTEGLKDYAGQKNLASSLQSTLRSNAYLTYYNSVKENTLDLSLTIDKSKEGFSKLKKIYPGTNLFNVYFLVGAMTAGGRVSDNGLLIAVEMFSKNEDTKFDDLSEWHQNVLRNKEYLSSIVVHELIHKQQQYRLSNSNAITTLELSIVEGMADFISHYLLNDEPFMNEHLHFYGDPIEEELWIEFKPQMDLNYQKTEWLFTGKRTMQGHPADMGYYMGYKILEAYSSNFENVEAAIIAMLSATDYQEIFQTSNYGDKFN